MFRQAVFKLLTPLRNRIAGEARRASGFDQPLSVEEDHLNSLSAHEKSVLSSNSSSLEKLKKCEPLQPGPSTNDSVSRAVPLSIEEVASSTRGEEFSEQSERSLNDAVAESAQAAVHPSKNSQKMLIIHNGDPSSDAITSELMSFSIEEYPSRYDPQSWSHEDVGFEKGRLSDTYVQPGSRPINSIASLSSCRTLDVYDS